MFTWLATLPLAAQISLIIGTLVVAVILAYIGKVNIKLGKYVVSFGKPRTTRITRRSCADCRQLVMIRTMKFDQDIKIIRDDVLRDQMNYAEQKLHELTYCLTSSYREDLTRARKVGIPVDIAIENKEYMLYQESLSCAMLQVKNEVRRSFKENGFYELGPNEFTDYVSGKTKQLINIGREYIRARYPLENMIIPIETRFGKTPESSIEAAVADGFLKAKQIKLSAEEKIKTASRKYDEDMLEFESM